MRVGALTKECELSKHSVKQLKGQVQQLQELLANREQEHRYSVCRVCTPMNERTSATTTITKTTTTIIMIYIL